MKTIVKKITEDYIILGVLDENYELPPILDIHISNKLEHGYRRIMGLNKGSEILLKNNAIVNIGMRAKMRNKEHDKLNGWVVKLDGTQCILYNNINKLVVREQSILNLDVTSGNNDIKQIV